MPADPCRVKELFAAALDLPDSEARKALLDRECADDSDLRNRLGRLLAANDDPASALNKPLAAPHAEFTSDFAGDAVGTVIAGRYKLLEELGEGGMGTVWVAEQTQPVRRKVAVKLIKPGMDSKTVLSRFEAERQALALMDHPNIAKVLDGGRTEQGRPFFVMEYVKGVPMTTYCDNAQLTVRERLELFVPVCQAVQHAHQKGIIHRDLKPSNILICLYDGRPVPKVIDFGLAKALHQPLTEHTLYTAHGLMLGTPMYMSPEQAEFNNLDVDTRTDVYSLGVLLYELLTGSTPLEKRTLKEVAWQELVRLIKDVEPPKPSTRLSTSGSLPSVAAQRKGEPAKLSRLVRGELDWIVMKALEKDRGRRYETANGLARDVQRYLADEAVEACPPSVGYRLRKFTRKHRGSLTTAAALVALLVAGAAVCAWQALRAMRAEAAAIVARDAEIAERQAAQEQRDRAADAEGQAQASAAQARAEEQKATRSAAEAEAVLRFLQDKVLAAARPEGQEGGQGRDVTIRAALDAAEPAIAAAFADQPAMEAAIRHTLGRTYRFLGEPASAIRQHERALMLRRQILGPDHRETLTAMQGLALAYSAAARWPEAVALHEETLKLRRTRSGPDDRETLRSMQGLAAAYWGAGRQADATALHEETLKLRRTKLGPDDSDTLASMGQLAAAYRQTGRLPEAIVLIEQASSLYRAKLGADHPDTLNSMSELARAYQNAGRPDEARSLSAEVLRLRRIKLGAEHPDTLASMNDVARGEMNAGRYVEAQQLFEETLRLYQTKYGVDHQFTLSVMGNLALCYHYAGRVPEALALEEKCLAIRRAKLGADHPSTLVAMNNLASLFRDTGRMPEAIALLCMGRRSSCTGPSPAPRTKTHSRAWAIWPGRTNSPAGYRKRSSCAGRSSPCDDAKSPPTTR
jgi:serine/threonine protein kinase